MTARIMTAITALLLAATVRGEMEAPNIKAVVKPEKATVGSVLEYRVNIAVKGASSFTIVPPEKREYYPEKKKDAARQKKTAQGEESEEDPAQYVPLYVIHSIKKDDRSDKTMTDITVSMQVSFYRPGTWSLPDVEIKGPDGIDVGYKVPTVEIAAVNEKAEYQDIEPPLELGGNWWRIAALGLCIIAAAVAAFFAWRYIRRRLEARRQAPVIIPPIEIFLKEIGELDGDRLIDEGKIEEFVFGISMIFRKFLSQQFRFDATDMTTYEIEKKIRKTFPRTLLDAYFDDIMLNFNMWDLSKFAEFTPTKEQLHDSLAGTIDLAKNISGEMSVGIPRV
jgi:hypothetical protein